jgi:hypothetical protein
MIMTFIDQNTKSLDDYIHFIVRENSLSPDGLGFIGRRKLLVKVSQALPDTIFIIDGKFPPVPRMQFTKNHAMKRLEAMLSNGLAQKLHNMALTKTWDGFGESIDNILEFREGLSQTVERESPPTSEPSPPPFSPSPPSSQTDSLPSIENGQTAFDSADPIDARRFVPSEVQYPILVCLQAQLECAFYHCLMINKPHIILQKSWTSPHCAELSVYTRIPELIDFCFGPGHLPNKVPPAFKELCNIRHIAVHRNQITYKKLDHLLRAAADVAQRLEAKSLSECIRSFRDLIQYRLDNVKKNLQTVQEQHKQKRREVEELRIKLHEAELSLEGLAKACEEQQRMELKLLQKCDVERVIMNMCIGSNIDDNIEKVMVDHKS